MALPRANDPSDAHLLGGIAADDSMALRRLMDRYDRLVRYTAYRISRERCRRDPLWLDSVASEVWTDLCRAARAGRTQAVADIQSYLIQIARRRCIDALRRRGETPVGSGANEAAYTQVPAAEEDTAHLLATLEELSALHLHRARCYRLAGDYESAHSDLNQAIYWNPSTPYPHSKKGELYYLTMKDEDAVESFSRAIEMGITNGYLVDVLFQRALSYIEMKEYDAAVADITELLRHEPGRINAYYFRGLSYFYQGDDEHCSDDLEHFLEVGSDPRLIPEARSILTATEIYRQ